MPHGSSSKKVANGLVALSSAAVLAVYSAGYSRTRAAANRLEVQADQRRPEVPVAPRAADRIPEHQPEAPGESAGAAVPEPAAPSKPIKTAEPIKAVAGVPESVTAAVPAETSIASPPPAPVVEQAPSPAAPAVEPKPEPPPAAPSWKDGTYTGWGSSRHGDIQALVVIEGGRIASATIAQCLTRYSCSVIEKLPPEVAARQSAEIDYVSGATQSTNAFYYAVVDALSKAK
jgi:uncharacterized protein with FMN-binding domain